MRTSSNPGHLPLSEVTSSRPAVVVGGGIAGLSAAWELRRLGVPVKVVETTPHLGGRIQTELEHSGRVETGMQFYYSSYRQTRRLLREVGLLGDLVPIHILGLIYHEGRVEPFSKTRPWLRHLGVGENFRLQAAIVRKILALLRMSTFESRPNERLDQMDVAEYFTRRGNERIVEVAVRPMVNSYAFCEPEGHSLAMLLRIVKLGALAKTYGLRQGNDSLPRALASRLDVTQGEVTEVVIDDGRVEAVVLDRDGRREALPTSLVVCATGAPQASKILRSESGLSAALGELSHSSIVLANLFLDRPLTGKEWVYVLSRKAGHRAAFAVDLARRAPAMFPGGKSVLQVDFTTPVSDELLPRDDEAIARQATTDMEAFLPGIGGWVTRTSVVRRPRALPNFPVGTFARVRVIEDAAARVRGLHLAGDYLRSPLCESAVRSGQQCAAAAAGRAVKRLGAGHRGRRELRECGTTAGG